MMRKTDSRTNLKSRREKQMEIMRIPDREQRLRTIAKNIELFTGKKAR